jgi:hypothetical protein
MSNSRPSLAVWLYGNPYPSIHRMIDHPLQALDNFKSELTSEMVNEKIEYILVNKLEQDQE